MASMVVTLVFLQPSEAEHAAASQPITHTGSMSGTGGITPRLGLVIAAMKTKNIYLHRSITVNVTPTNKPDLAPFAWTVSLAKHPDLLTLSYNSTYANYVIDQKKLSALITKDAFSGELANVSPVVTDVVDDSYVIRAKDTLIARPGMVYDPDALASQIATALIFGNATVDVKAPYQDANITLNTGTKNETLSLLSNGISDDSDSPVDRIWNVHKAIDERVNNVILAPGQVFSFVSVLGGPVTLQKGWRMELGLFGGGAAMTPGAGICQAATTVFRSALLAGLPIVERRNHSEWVPHYAVYGAGLDATVFPGFHDLRFSNNTGHDIVIQSYINGTTVYVKMYGVADGRTVTLDGPYFNTTQNRSPDIRPIGTDEAGWVYTVTAANGTQMNQQALVATYYKGIPRKTKNKYATPVGISILSAGAPLDLRPMTETE
jgi:vancomycin resistance protein YoaR